MKIEKIIKTFAIAAVMAGSVFTLSQTTEAATVSIEKAAEKIYKAETKAYNAKKDVKVTVKLASASSRKSIQKTIENMEDALIKEELGDVDLTYVLRGKYIKPSIGGLIYWTGHTDCFFRDDWYDTFYYPHNDCAEQDVSYKKGVLTVKFDIKGSKKKYRNQYKENTYLAKIVEELREQTVGMSEKDKAWTVAEWVEKHFWYDGQSRNGNKTSYSRFWINKAQGVCEQEARSYQLFACLMGLNAGYVSEPDINHGSNCVKIDGKVYCLQIGFIGTNANDWERIATSETSEEKEHMLSLSTIAEVKEWNDGITVGEWCLLTAEQSAYVLNDAADAPSRWKVYWMLGSRPLRLSGELPVEKYITVGL